MESVYRVEEIKFMSIVLNTKEQMNAQNMKKDIILNQHHHVKNDQQQKTNV